MLRVFTWAGPWGAVFEEYLKPMFEQSTGATLLLDNGWGEEIPRLLASPSDQPPYDVMIVAPFSVYAVIRRGHFRKLDWTKIPNAKLFHKRALDNWVAEDGWGLTWPDALHTAIYRSDMQTPPKSWADILETRASLYRASYMSLYTFAAAYAPARAAQAMQEDFSGVWNFAKRHRDGVQHWWSTSPDMAFNLLQGHLDSGNIHSVDVFPLLAEKKPLSVFVTEDRAHFQAIWLVPKGTRYSELAHEFLNLFASPEFQRKYAAAGFPTPIASLAAETAAENPTWARINPHTEQDFAKLQYYPYDAYVRHWGDMTERWNQEILV